MEESEKRRERLRAMRAEASQSGASSEICSEFHQLSNPFTESSVTSSVQSTGTMRFDYYTDPMAAFSNTKRMNKDSYQNSPGTFNHFPTPRNPQMTPSPAHQVGPTYSPEPRMFQPRSPCVHSSRPMTPSPAHHVQHAYSPDPRMFQPQSSYNGSPAHHVQHAYSLDPRMFQPQSSPAHQSQPYYPNPRMYQSPRGQYHNSGPRNPNMPPDHEGQYGNFQPRGPNQCSYTHNRAPGLRGSPSPNLGRGRGRSVSGQGGSRPHGNVSAESSPHSYYNKSMLEDPWKNLKPSLWKNEIGFVKRFNTPRSFPNKGSFGTKKARVLEPSKESTSQPSLAEYLAAAFNETVGEEGNNDKSIL